MKSAFTQLDARESPASTRQHGSRLQTSIPTTTISPDERDGGRERDEQRTEQPTSAPDYAETFEPLIDSVEAAKLLGNMHVKTVQRYARTGVLPACQIGRHWYFRASELDAWIRIRINSNCQSVR